MSSTCASPVAQKRSIRRNEDSHPKASGASGLATRPTPSLAATLASESSISPLGAIHFAPPSSPSFSPFNINPVSYSKARRALSTLMGLPLISASESPEDQVEQHSTNSRRPVPRPLDHNSRIHTAVNAKQHTPSLSTNHHNPSFVAFSSGYEQPRRMNIGQRNATSSPPYSEKVMVDTRARREELGGCAGSVEERRLRWEREERRRAMGN